MTDYRTYSLSSGEWTVFLAVAYPAAAAILFLFYGSMRIAVPGGLGCLFMVPLYKEHLMEKRKRELEGEFKDFLYFISSATAAGHPMASAMREAERNLITIYGPKAPLCRELSTMNAAVTDHRESEDVLLKDLGMRSGISDIAGFAEIYGLCRELGGDRAEIIATTGKVLTDKINLMREIRMLTAQKQFESRIIAAMPLAVILGLDLCYPEYLSVFYTTFAGRLLMTMGLGGIVAAFFLMRRIIDIEV